MGLYDMRSLPYAKPGRYTAEVTEVNLGYTKGKSTPYVRLTFKTSAETGVKQDFFLTEKAIKMLANFVYLTNMPVDQQRAFDWKNERHFEKLKGLKIVLTAGYDQQGYISVVDFERYDPNAPIVREVFVSREEPARAPRKQQQAAAAPDPRDYATGPQYAQGPDDDGRDDRDMPF